MRSFPLILALAACLSCSPDDERYPPGTSGPVGPGTSTGSPPPDGGPDRDGGPDSGDEASFICGDEAFACEDPEGFANCCDGAFVECPPDFPIYCPSDTYCWFEEGAHLCVEPDACTFVGLACR